MKILLIRPPFYSLFGVTTPKMKTYPLNLIYLSTYLRDIGGYEAEILDGENIVLEGLKDRINDKLDPGEIMQQAIPIMNSILEDPEHPIWKEIQNSVSDRSPDIVGITCNSGNMDTVGMMTGKIREMGIPVILGGSHPTVLPRESLEYTSADFAICGEGEFATYELLEALKTGDNLADCPSLAWRNGSDIIVNPKAQLIHPLEKLPIPDRSFINRAQYFGEVIITGRGCPYDCVYCASKNIWGKRVRLRKVESVIEELEMIKSEIEGDNGNSGTEPSRPGAWVVKIVDDTFTVIRRRTIELLDEIIRRGLNCFEFTGGVRVDTLDEEVVDKMAQANVKRVTIGVESGSPRILEMIKKGVTNKQVIKGIELLRQAGIHSHAFFMVGLPGERPEDIELSKELILQARPDHIEVNMVTPYPGTLLWDQLMDLGPAEIKQWRRWFHQGMATHSNKLGFDLDAAYQEYVEFARQYHQGLI